MARMPFRKLVVALLMFAVILSGCQAGSYLPASNTSTEHLVQLTTTLTDLRDIEQLQMAFNAAQGPPRLILLLSPT